MPWKHFLQGKGASSMCSINVKIKSSCCPPPGRRRWRRPTRSPRGSDRRGDPPRRCRPRRGPGWPGRPPAVSWSHQSSSFRALMSLSLSTQTKQINVCLLSVSVSEIWNSKCPLKLKVVYKRQLTVYISRTLRNENLSQDLSINLRQQNIQGSGHFPLTVAL